MNQEAAIQDGVCPYCGERFTEYADLYEHLLERADIASVPDKILLLCMRLAAEEEISE